MDRTLGYWIEKVVGVCTGFLCAWFCLAHWHSTSFISESALFDKLITICTTLFGFLLTVLTLIVQSDSEAIKSMKAHGSYKRLIIFNKTIVLLSGVICIFSLVLFFGCLTLKIAYPEIFKILSALNLALFVWVIVDTSIFVLIFYKILISGYK